MDVGETWQTSAASVAAAPRPFSVDRFVSQTSLLTGISAVAVIAVGAAAKLPEAILPIGTDTGMYATYARQMLQGGRPYLDFYDVHPPLTYYYWVLVQALAGTDFVSDRCELSSRVHRDSCPLS